MFQTISRLWRLVWQRKDVLEGHPRRCAVHGLRPSRGRQEPSHNALHTSLCNALYHHTEWWHLESYLQGYYNLISFNFLLGVSKTIYAEYWTQNQWLKVKILYLQYWLKMSSTEMYQRLPIFFIGKHIYIYVFYKPAKLYFIN